MCERSCIDLNQVFNASKDLLAIIDLSRNIKNINRSYLQFLGKIKEEVLHQPCKNHLKGDLCRSEECPFRQVVEQGNCVELEVIKRDRHNRAYPMLLTASPFRSREGVIIGMIESFKDVSLLKQSENRIRRLFSGTIGSISEVVEARDPYTAGHQQRVARIAGKIVEKMGLPDRVQNSVNIASMIHDIGKVYVPLEFLTKPGRLTDIEFEVIKTHVSKGYDILKPIPFEDPVAAIVRQHHERMDGTGYPAGLAGEMILLESRIIAVADVVEAISSHRPYRPALGTDAAMDEIRRFRGVKYDSDVVDACLSVMQ